MNGPPVSCYDFVRDKMDLIFLTVSVKRWFMVLFVCSRYHTFFISNKDAPKSTKIVQSDLNSRIFEIVSNLVFVVCWKMTLDCIVKFQGGKDIHTKINNIRTGIV